MPASSRRAYARRLFGTSVSIRRKNRAWSALSMRASNRCAPTSKRFMPACFATLRNASAPIWFQSAIAAALSDAVIIGSSSALLLWRCSTATITMALMTLADG
jgi:hypothetical protein